jgi:hypothetical protein
MSDCFDQTRDEQPWEREWLEQHGHLIRPRSAMPEALPFVPAPADPTPPPLLDELAAVLGPGNDDATAYAQAGYVIEVLEKRPHLAFSVQHGALWQDVCRCGRNRLTLRTADLVSGEIEERPTVALASPEQLRGAAAQLRSVSPVQATQPFGKILGSRAVRVIADALDECARLRTTTASAREKRLEERADQLAILATTRRLPLAAVAGLVARADEAGAESVSVDAIRQALAATEPRL